MNIVRVSIYTALVLVATIILQVYTPATRGYFNLGETAIYVIAALSTPLTAGLASGVGSALADLITGYGIFAPGTLVIKFAEGFLASLLISNFRRVVRDLVKLRLISISIGIGLGVLIAWVGMTFFTGVVELYSIPLSFMALELTAISTVLTISTWFWVAVGLVIAGLISYIVIRVRGESLSFVIPILISGSVMVLGYFLYEYFISNPLQGIPPEEAFIEVPVNIGQALVGLTLSSPIISFISRARE